MLSKWEKIMIPMNRLWLHGLYGLHVHGPWYLLSPKRLLNLITHSLTHLQYWCLFNSFSRPITSLHYCPFVTAVIHWPVDSLLQRVSNMSVYKEFTCHGVILILIIFLSVSKHVWNHASVMLFKSVLEQYFCTVGFHWFIWILFLSTSPIKITSTNTKLTLRN